MPNLPFDHPPELGLIQLEIPVAPVSFQASARRKAPVVEAIRNVVAPVRYLLSGDIKVFIEWQVTEKDRYESDASPDVDNIVKPILDSLTGPAGLFVDDCQVQELTCYWTDLVFGSERLLIELKFLDDSYLLKEGLIFLHLGHGKYFPLYSDLGPERTLERAEQILDRYAKIEKLIELGARPEQARQLRPIQRVFHKSRLAGFPLTSIEDLRAAR